MYIPGMPTKADIANDALLRIGIAEPCCDDWLNANKSGTDNEGYEALVSGRRIGYELPPVKFCPWCGAPKTTA